MSAARVCPDLTTGAPTVSRAELRHTLGRYRASLPPELIAGWSAAIRARASALDIWSQSEVVHAYLGVLPGEVRTESLVEQALRERKRVLCPRVRPHGQLDHRELLDTSHLRESSFGLLEPDADLAPPADPAAADLILVPGVAFSADGARLGMGGGYYDRFLVQTNAHTIGLAFEMQIQTELPQRPHDQRIDMIVTELRVIQCR